MKYLIIILSLFLINCKQGSESGKASIADESPEFIIDEEGDIAPNYYIEGYLREPTQAEIDHTYSLTDEDMPERLFGPHTNSPHYYECRMLGVWYAGVDKTYYFNYYFDGGANIWAIRVDRDGVTHHLPFQNVFSDWLGRCYVELNKVTNEILYVKWQHGLYEEIIKDIR